MLMIVCIIAVYSRYTSQPVLAKKLSRVAKAATEGTR